MKTFERLKNMNVEEMAKAITKGIASIQCDCCIYEGECSADYCFGILYWLTREADDE